MNKTIAIIGASSRREKFGNKAVRAFTDAGYTVYPVNPEDDTIEGLTVYRSVADIPGEVSYASLYLNPAVGITVLDDLKAKGITEVFANPGAESPELIARGTELGLNVMAACSIVATGKSPADYPD